MKKLNLIGDKQFYKMVLTVALPIMMQNLVTNFVSLLDNFMIGKLGTEEISGVSIANQMMLVCNLALFGAISGIGIYTAQFYGKKDVDGQRSSLRFKLYTGTAISVIFGIIMLFFREDFIRLFLHDDNIESAELTLGFASVYLLVMITGLIPFGISQAIAGTLRETGDTIAPMIASIAAVVTNASFNYILIFGKFGAPKLGVKGAAIATVISRFAELAFIVIYAAVRRKKFPYLHGLLSSFRIPKEHLPGYLAKGGSLMLNEILWSGAITALSIAYSLHGLHVVAGYSISSTVVNLFFITCMSLGIASGIITGKELGAGNHERAILYARQLLFFSVSTCVLVSVLLILVGGQIPKLYNTSDESKAIATYFITISALMMPADAFCNNSYFALRSGGKTFITVLFDAGTMWFLSVPTAFALYYFAHLDITVVYPVVISLHVVKATIGYFLLRSKIWVNTIV